MNRLISRNLRPPLACRLCPLRRLRSIVPVTGEELEFIQRIKAGEALLPAGSHLARNGSDAGDFYTLRSGWAFRFHTLSSGGRQILCFLLPGDFFALPEDTAAGGRHGVELLTAGVLCRFPARQLAGTYDSHPRLGSHLTWIAELREAQLASNLAAVGRTSAVQRVAALLADLHGRAVGAGLQRPDGTVEFPLTQRHVADALGMSLAHTHRTLRQLGRRLLYSLGNGRLAVLQPSELARLADCSPPPARPRPLF